jgi:outer membrane protein assembly factor BamB
MVLAPVATDAGLVVQTRSGVSLLDTTDGTPLWEQSLDANATDGMPAVAGGRIYLADNQGSLHARDLASGESLWTTEFTGETAPVVADGVVYAVETNHSLVAIDAESGDQRFSYQPEVPPLSAPVVGEDTVFLATGDSILALEADE